MVDANAQPKKASAGEKRIFSPAVAVLSLLAAVLLGASMLLGAALHTGFFPVQTTGNVSSRPSGPATSLPTTGQPQPPDSGGQDDPPIEDPPVFSVPQEMRGSVILPGKDYRPADKPEKVRKQIDEALKTLVSYGFNTVLMPVQADGEAICPDVLPPAPQAGIFDPLQYLIEQARAKGLYVYAVFDCGVYSGEVDPTLPEQVQQIERLLDGFLRCYQPDGWMLTAYGYAYGKSCDKEAFEAQQQFTDKKAFMADAVDKLVHKLVGMIRTYDRDLYTGLLSSAVWAHRKVDERGSQTSNLYEEWTDGRADTMAWLQQGLFDFVMVQSYVSTNDAQASFAHVLSWWDKLCTQAKIPLYVMHASHLAGTSKRAWKSPDQLTLQLLLCRRAESWKGSSFSSLQALKKNPGGSTDALVSAFNGTLLEGYISNTLQLTTPQKLSITVDAPDYVLRGTADPNFVLKMNGRAVELTKNGYFAIPVTLTVGRNTFTFEHKGEKQTYTIIYKVRVLRSVTPAEDQLLDGGSVLAVSAIALKGATVTFSINGKTVTMTASPLQEGVDSEDLLGIFERYTGTYTLPKGASGRVLELGAVTVNASFNGLEEKELGGKVSIVALPVNSDAVLPDTIEGLAMRAPDAGAGAVLIGGQIVVISSDYAETFDGGNSTDDYSRPTNAYMPRGTTDVLLKKVVANGNTYYLLGSGRRVYASDAWLSEGQRNLHCNTLSGAAVLVATDYTLMTLQSEWFVPYNLQLLPQKYANAAGKPPKYTINSYGQTTEYIEITFHYTALPEALPDMTDSPLFSRAEWSQGAQENTAVLRLYLRSKGEFYGYSVVWDAEGCLHFSFKHSPSTAAAPENAPLQGLTIVLDPGHGGSDKNTPIFGITEKKLALDYSLSIRDKLEELGATVIMTRSTDVNVSHKQRVLLARNTGVDLFLSIHMNAATSGNNLGKPTTASGATVHYFNEYSYALSQMIANKIKPLEDSYDIGNRSSMVHWDPFYVIRVHDNPSVLVECGFYDNPKDSELLQSSTYREQMTQAIVDGVVEYFRHLPQQ